MLDRVRVIAADDAPPSAAKSDSPLDAIIQMRKAPVKGIAVLGSHPATVIQAPFDDEGWIIFACSPHNIEHRTLPRWDMWSEIHLPVQHQTRSYHYLRGLEQQAREKQARGEHPVVWLRDQAALPHYAGGRLYPDEEMRGRKVVHKDGRIEFEPGLFHRSQFKSSIAFMMAMAIVECERLKIPAIGLWGILQRGKGGEYENQRPSTQYFLEEAVRRGIKTYVSPESGLFHDDPEVF